MHGTFSLSPKHTSVKSSRKIQVGQWECLEDDLWFCRIADAGRDDLIAGCIVSRMTGQRNNYSTSFLFWHHISILSHLPAVPDQTTPGLTLVHLSSHFDYMLRGARRVGEKEPHGWRWGIEGTVWIITLYRHSSDSCALTSHNRLKYMAMVAHLSCLFLATLARPDTPSQGTRYHIADWLITRGRTWTSVSKNSHFLDTQTLKWALTELKQVSSPSPLTNTNNSLCVVGIMWL